MSSTMFPPSTRTCTDTSWCQTTTSPRSLGQRVEIEGTLADRKDGKVEIKTETKAEGAAKDTHSKVEGKGPYLGVKHMKRISGTCS